MEHAQPGLDGRHRDADGEIGRKHGQTLILTIDNHGDIEGGQMVGKFHKR